MKSIIVALLLICLFQIDNIETSCAGTTVAPTTLTTSEASKTTTTTIVVRDRLLAGETL
jgi:hypothetical protein